MASFSPVIAFSHQVRLLDAYQQIAGKDRQEVASQKATSLVYQVASSLEEREPSTGWSTLDRQRQSMSEIGAQIRMKVIPAMTDESASKEDIGDKLVHLSRFLFEGSAQSVEQALQLFKEMPKTKRPEAVQMITPWTRLRTRIGARPMNYLVAAGTVGAVLAIVYAMARDMILAIGVASLVGVIIALAKELETGKARVT